MVYVVTSPGGTVTMVRDRYDPAAARTSEFHRLVPDNGGSTYFCAGPYALKAGFNAPDEIRRWVVEQLNPHRVNELAADWSRRNAQLVAENNAKRGWPCR